MTQKNFNAKKMLMSTLAAVVLLYNSTPQRTLSFVGFQILNF